MPGADYLGPELNGRVYRFKFIQDGKVIWVDVDARSGRILRRVAPALSPRFGPPLRRRLTFARSSHLACVSFRSSNRCRVHRVEAAKTDSSEGAIECAF